MEKTISTTSKGITRFVTKTSRRFSIVIPTKNRADQITVLIKQLLAQQYPKNTFEIIVVDNGSVDTTVNRLKRMRDSDNLRIVSVSAPGPSYARNYGYRLTRFDYVIFLDDDIQVKSDFLSKYANAWQQHPDASIIGGRIIPSPKILGLNPSDRISRLSLIRRYEWIYACVNYGNKPTLLTINNLLCSATLSVNKQLFSKDGHLFNTIFGTIHLGLLIFAEDYELCNRVMLEGGHVWYTPRVTTTHFFNPERFKKIYIFKRHILAGAENFLMNTLLKKRYPSFARYTFTHTLFSSIKNLLRRRDSSFIKKFTDPMFCIFFVSYFTLGPVLFILIRSVSRQHYETRIH